MTRIKFLLLLAAMPVLLCYAPSNGYVGWAYPSPAGDKIAVRGTTQNPNRTVIWLIPASSTSLTLSDSYLRYTFPENAFTNCLSWSPSGDRLAFAYNVQSPTTSVYEAPTLRTITTSGTLTETEYLSGKLSSGSLDFISWSRTSPDRLLFTHRNTNVSNAPNEIYYYALGGADPAKLATAATTGLGAVIYNSGPLWSPNDASFMFKNHSTGLRSSYNLSTGAVTSLGDNVGPYDWRRF